MNEIEARGKIKYRIANEMRKYGENKEEYEDLEIAIQALKEIREYRELGTVEGYERAIKSSIENYNLYREYKAKVQEFEAIGTVEEFKALKEKSVERKVIDFQINKMQSFCKDDFGRDIPCIVNVFQFKCPNCNKKIASRFKVGECPNCGQKLDWE